MVAVHLVFWSLSLPKEISCTSYIYTHRKIVKSPLLHQSLGPCVFFVSLSLCLSLRLILWSIETRHSHSPAQASKSPWRGGPVPMWAMQALYQGLYWFSVETREYQPLSLFHFLILDSGPPGSGPLKDPNIQNHKLFGTQLSLWSNSHIRICLLEKLQLWLDGPLSAK